ncbi:MAG: hypothetical protein KF774_18495 [Planctomyces sp.]|nr:hypothetical protein [Planctomyces sp.]
MANWTRRDWLASVSAAAALRPFAARGEDEAPNQGLRIGTFRTDVTPPLGHALCGGWIPAAGVIDDPLEAIGLVILGAGQPIVLCAVDWTGLLNGAQSAWQRGLAEAVGTDPSRVAVHCVHQHNAPFACLDSQAIIERTTELPPMLDLAFFEAAVSATARVASEAVRTARPLTHIASGQAPVDRVAGNRRMLGADGRVKSMRGSASKDPEHHAAPEGLIDPFLKTVAFYSGEERIAACHYYACHPMSYYGDGRVSADFCGLARRQRQTEDPGCTHLYFNGCGGNIGAGKYNDGSHAMRPILTSRIHDALVASEAALRPEPLDSVGWTTADVRLPPDPKWDAAALAAQIADPARSAVDRYRPAYTLAYLNRFAADVPITLSALHVNSLSLLHLPAECFAEYQLRAQSASPGRFVACAAYGDGGPWYIPTRAAFPQGGYEVSVSWCGPEVDDALWTGMARLLAEAPRLPGA